jgi:multicomponent Na+:H+ antiporter subunit G
MSQVLDIIGMLLVGVGVLFFLGAAIGVLRFPDFYTRMHAAGKGDTLSTLLIVVGIAIEQCHALTLPGVLMIMKLLIISFFIFTTGPTATHALMRAGHQSGIPLWQRKRRSE